MNALLKDLGSYWNPDVERCGVILTDGSILQLPNTSPTPALTFELSLEGLPDISATWHTHPTTGGNLSTPDYLLFLQHPKLWHYIVGGPNDVRAYYIEDSRVMLHEDPDPA